MVKLSDKATLSAAHESETRDGGAVVALDPLTGHWVVIGSARVVELARLDPDGQTRSELAGARDTADRGDADRQATAEEEAAAAMAAPAR